MTALLRRIRPEEIAAARRDPVDAATLAIVAPIVADVRVRGEAAVRQYAEKFGDVPRGAPLVRGKGELLNALRALPADQQQLLQRTADRIHHFADAQRRALREIEVAVPGGHAGHTVAPVERAGCYAPGGRFPLPSSVLMTAVTARAAGVATVWVASPKPTPVTLAAAAVAGADGFLAVGGAQAIAALAFGAGPVPACDVVVGPGNKWVTAAKQCIAGRVGIDMLAGPSELLVIADGSADPAVVAADLLAQAEHDPDARPMLVALDLALVEQVEREIAIQLKSLPTAATASAAIAGGFAVVVPDTAAAAAVADAVAPEHLQIMVRDPSAIVPRLRHYGALFVGHLSAEVLGDYGIGPNHVLPTGGTARLTGGLSVFTFLRTRTWLHVDDPAGVVPMARDATALARLEGLEGHARAAEFRVPRNPA